MPAKWGFTFSKSNRQRVMVLPNRFALRMILLLSNRAGFIASREHRVYTHVTAVSSIILVMLPNLQGFSTE